MYSNLDIGSCIKTIVTLWLTACGPAIASCCVSASIFLTLHRADFEKKLFGKYLVWYWATGGQTASYSNGRKSNVDRRGKERKHFFLITVYMYVDVGRQIWSIFFVSDYYDVRSVPDLFVEGNNFNLTCTVRFSKKLIGKQCF